MTIALILIGIGICRAAWTQQRFLVEMREWASSEDVVDPHGALESWRDTSLTSPCQFEGITCDNNGNIKSLILVDCGLVGSLPPWIWNVADSTVDLSNNDWSYTTTFYQDTSSEGDGKDNTATLTMLRCSDCKFYYKAKDGEYALPEEWSMFSKLETLDVSNNVNLIGELPLSWSKSMRKLKTLNISGTSICGSTSLSQTAPPEFTILGNLQEVCKDLPERSSPEVVSLPSPPPIALPDYQDEEAPPSAISSACQDDDLDLDLDSIRVRAERKSNLITEIWIDVGDSSNDVCSEYDCRLSISGEIGEPVFDGLSKNGVWHVRLENGHYLAVVMVTDEICTKWSDELEVKVDTSSPICSLDSLSFLKDKDLHVLTLKCSEEMGDLIENLIDVTDNGKLVSVEAVGPEIIISVQQIQSSRPEIYVALRQGCLWDRQGNTNEEDLIFEIPVKPTLVFQQAFELISEAPVDEIVTGIIVVSSGLSTGAVMVGSGASGAGAGAQSNFVRTGFHLQSLALTTNLAVPAMSSSYLESAAQFKWTTLSFGFRGNPDRSLSNPVPYLRISKSSTDSDSIGGRRLMEESTLARSAFLDTMKGFGAICGLCLLIRFTWETSIRLFSISRRPAMLKFPRLEVQVSSMMAPPLTLACTQLIATGSPEDAELGLFTLIVVVLPFVVWYTCFLSIRDLILNPEIYFKRVGKSESTESNISQVDTTSNPSTLYSLDQSPSETSVDIYDRAYGDRIGGASQIMRRAKLFTTGSIHVNASGRSTPLRTSRIWPVSSDLDTSDCSERALAIHSSEKHPIDRRTPSSDPTEDESLQWILAERHPEREFIAKYGFVFENVLGKTAAVGRNRLKVEFLMTHSVFFVHKIITSTIYGFTSKDERNPYQVSALIAMQVMATGYLICIRPYASTTTMILESIMSMKQMAIYIFAFLLLLEIRVEIINTLMLSCFMSAALTLAAFELEHLFALIPIKCRKRIS